MTIYERHDINDLYDLRDLCWSGALSRIDEAIEYEIDGDFFEYIKDYFENWVGNDTIDIEEINDFIWFECDDWLEEHKPQEKED